MTLSPGADPSTDAAPMPVASRFIRSLLNRHDVAPMRHATTIARLLGIGPSPAYRRMNGAVAWEIEEIEKIGAHFGESLADVFAGDRTDDFIAAMLAAGGVRVPCQLVVGNAVRDPERNSLVAIRAGAQWLVVPASEAGAATCFEVRRMLVSSDAERRWRIAVLDDDVRETASLDEYLSARGCDVLAFSAVEELIGHMKARPFDAYVIDWVLGEESAAELVGMIRADDRECPIVVLTGKMRDDLTLIPAVAEAVATYKLLFFEKPTRLPIISAQLLQALARPAG